MSKAPTVPFSAIAAISEEKVNATQKKFQNFDTELTQLISGLKSNLRKESGDSSTLDDDKLLFDIDVGLLGESPKKENEEIVIDQSNEKPEEWKEEKQAASPNESTNQVNSNKPLADITVDLNDIRPHDEFTPRCIMDEKCGLKIMLNFTKDKPRDDVAVLVITTTNHNRLPIKNFQFEASVPKVSISNLLEMSMLNGTIRAKYVLNT